MKTALLRSSAAKGVLQRVSADAINIVNAVSNAQERCIRIDDSAETHNNGADGIRVMLASSNGRVTVRGIVVHASPHIAELDGIEVDSPLEGNILLLKNRDLPGVIGVVGTFLGEAEVNIARFVLGRGEKGSAIAIVQTDSPVSEPVLQKLRKLPNILEARSVSFPTA